MDSSEFIGSQTSFDDDLTFPNLSSKNNQETHNFIEKFVRECIGKSSRIQSQVPEATSPSNSLDSIVIQETNKSFDESENNTSKQCKELIDSVDKCHYDQCESTPWPIGLGELDCISKRAQILASEPVFTSSDSKVAEETELGGSENTACCKRKDFIESLPKPDDEVSPFPKDEENIDQLPKPAVEVNCDSKIQGFEYATLDEIGFGREIVITGYEIFDSNLLSSDEAVVDFVETVNYEQLAESFQDINNYGSYLTNGDKRDLNSSLENICAQEGLLKQTDSEKDRLETGTIEKTPPQVTPSEEMRNFYETTGKECETDPNESTEERKMPVLKKATEIPPSAAVDCPPPALSPENTIPVGVVHPFNHNESESEDSRNSKREALRSRNLRTTIPELNSSVTCDDSNSNKKVMSNGVSDLSFSNNVKKSKKIPFIDVHVISSDMTNGVDDNLSKEQESLHIQNDIENGNNLYPDNCCPNANSLETVNNKCIKASSKTENDISSESKSETIHKRRPSVYDDICVAGLENVDSYLNARKMSLRSNVVQMRSGCESQLPFLLPTDLDPVPPKLETKNQKRVKPMPNYKVPRNFQRLDLSKDVPRIHQRSNNNSHKDTLQKKENSKFLKLPKKSIENNVTLKNEKHSHVKKSGMNITDDNIDISENVAEVEVLTVRVTRSQAKKKESSDETKGTLKSLTKFVDPSKYFEKHRGCLLADENIGDQLSPDFLEDTTNSVVLNGDYRGDNTEFDSLRNKTLITDLSVRLLEKEIFSVFTEDPNTKKVIVERVLQNDNGTFLHPNYETEDSLPEKDKLVKNKATNSLSMVTDLQCFRIENENEMNIFPKLPINNSPVGTESPKNTKDGFSNEKLYSHIEELDSILLSQLNTMDDENVVASENKSHKEAIKDNTINKKKDLRRKSSMKDILQTVSNDVCTIRTSSNLIGKDHDNYTKTSGNSSNISSSLLPNGLISIQDNSNSLVELNSINSNSNSTTGKDIEEESPVEVPQKSSSGKSDSSNIMDSTLDESPSLLVCTPDILILSNSVETESTLESPTLQPAATLKCFNEFLNPYGTVIELRNSENHAPLKFEPYKESSKSNINELPHISNVGTTSPIDKQHSGSQEKLIKNALPSLKLETDSIQNTKRPKWTTTSSRKMKLATVYKNKELIELEARKLLKSKVFSESILKASKEKLIITTPVSKKQQVVMGMNCKLSKPTTIGNKTVNLKKANTKPDKTYPNVESLKVSINSELLDLNLPKIKLMKLAQIKAMENKVTNDTAQSKTHIATEKGILTNGQTDLCYDQSEDLCTYKNQSSPLDLVLKKTRPEPAIDELKVPISIIKESSSDLKLKSALPQSVNDLKEHCTMKEVSFPENVSETRKTETVLNKHEQQYPAVILDDCITLPSSLKSQEKSVVEPSPKSVMSDISPFYDCKTIAPPPQPSVAYKVVTTIIAGFEDSNISNDQRSDCSPQPFTEQKGSEVEKFVESNITRIKSHEPTKNIRLTGDSVSNMVRPNCSAFIFVNGEMHRVIDEVCDDDLEDISDGEFHISGEEDEDMNSSGSPMKSEKENEGNNTTRNKIHNRPKEMECSNRHKELNVDRNTNKKEFKQNTIRDFQIMNNVSEENKTEHLKSSFEKKEYIVEGNVSNHLKKRGSVHEVSLRKSLRSRQGVMHDNINKDHTNSEDVVEENKNHSDSTSKGNKRMDIDCSSCSSLIRAVEASRHQVEDSVNISSENKKDKIAKSLRDLGINDVVDKIKRNKLNNTGSKLSEVSEVNSIKTLFPPVMSDRAEVKQLSSQYSILSKSQLNKSIDASCLVDLAKFKTNVQLKTRSNEFSKELNYNLTPLQKVDIPRMNDKFCPKSTDSEVNDVAKLDMEKSEKEISKFKVKGTLRIIKNVTKSAEIELEFNAPGPSCLTSLYSHKKSSVKNLEKPNNNRLRTITNRPNRNRRTRTSVVKYEEVNSNCHIKSSNFIAEPQQKLKSMRFEPTSGEHSGTSVPLKYRFDIKRNCDAIEPSCSLPVVQCNSVFIAPSDVGKRESNMKTMSEGIREKQSKVQPEISEVICGHDTNNKKNKPLLGKEGLEKKDPVLIASDNLITEKSCQVLDKQQDRKNGTSHSDKLITKSEEVSEACENCLPTKTSLRVKKNHKLEVTKNSEVDKFNTARKSFKRKRSIMEGMKSGKIGMVVEKFPQEHHCRKETVATEEKLESNTDQNNKENPIHELKLKTTKDLRDEAIGGHLHTKGAPISRETEGTNDTDKASTKNELRDLISQLISVIEQKEDNNEVYVYTCRSLTNDTSIRDKYFNDGKNCHIKYVSQYVQEQNINEPSNNKYLVDTCEDTSKEENFNIQEASSKEDNNVTVETQPVDEKHLNAFTCENTNQEENLNLQEALPKEDNSITIEALPVDNKHLNVFTNTEDNEILSDALSIVGNQDTTQVSTVVETLGREEQNHDTNYKTGVSRKASVDERQDPIDTFCGNELVKVPIEPSLDNAEEDKIQTLPGEVIEKNTETSHKEEIEVTHESSIVKTIQDIVESSPNENNHASNEVTERVLESNIQTHCNEVDNNSPMLDHSKPGTNIAVTEVQNGTIENSFDKVNDTTDEALIVQESSTNNNAKKIVRNEESLFELKQDTNEHSSIEAIESPEDLKVKEKHDTIDIVVVQDILTIDEFSMAEKTLQNEPTDFTNETSQAEQNIIENSSDAAIQVKQKCDTIDNLSVEVIHGTGEAPMVSDNLNDEGVNLNSEALLVELKQNNVENSPDETILGEPKPAVDTVIQAVDKASMVEESLFNDVNGVIKETSLVEPKCDTTENLRLKDIQAVDVSQVVESLINGVIDVCNGASLVELKVNTIENSCDVAIQVEPKCDIIENSPLEDIRGTSEASLVETNLNNEEFDVCVGTFLVELKENIVDNSVDGVIQVEPKCVTLKNSPAEIIQATDEAVMVQESLINDGNHTSDELKETMVENSPLQAIQGIDESSMVEESFINEVNHISFELKEKTVPNSPLGAIQGTKTASLVEETLENEGIDVSNETLQAELKQNTHENSSDGAIQVQLICGTVEISSLEDIRATDETSTVEENLNNEAIYICNEVSSVELKQNTIEKTSDAAIHVEQKCDTIDNLSVEVVHRTDASMVEDNLNDEGINVSTAALLVELKQNQIEKLSNKEIHWEPKGDTIENSHLKSSQATIEASMIPGTLENEVTDISKISNETSLNEFKQNTIATPSLEAIELASNIQEMTETVDPRFSEEIKITNTCSPVELEILPNEVVLVSNKAATVEEMMDPVEPSSNEDVQIPIETSIDVEMLPTEVVQVSNEASNVEEMLDKMEPSVNEANQVTDEGSPVQVKQEFEIEEEVTVDNMSNEVVLISNEASADEDMLDPVEPSSNEEIQIPEETSIDVEILTTEVVQVSNEVSNVEEMLDKMEPSVNEANQVTNEGSPVQVKQEFEIEVEETEDNLHNEVVEVSNEASTIEEMLDTIEPNEPALVDVETVDILHNEVVQVSNEASTVEQMLDMIEPSSNDAGQVRDEASAVQVKQEVEEETMDILPNEVTVINEVPTVEKMLDTSEHSSSQEIPITNEPLVVDVKKIILKDSSGGTNQVSDELSSRDTVETIPNEDLSVEVVHDQIESSFTETMRDTYEDSAVEAQDDPKIEVQDNAMETHLQAIQFTNVQDSIVKTKTPMKLMNEGLIGIEKQTPLKIFSTKEIVCSNVESIVETMLNTIEASYNEAVQVMNSEVCRDRNICLHKEEENIVIDTSICDETQTEVSSDEQSQKTNIQTKYVRQVSIEEHEGIIESSSIEKEHITTELSNKKHWAAKETSDTEGMQVTNEVSFIEENYGTNKPSANQEKQAICSSNEDNQAPGDDLVIGEKHIYNVAISNTHKSDLSPTSNDNLSVDSTDSIPESKNGTSPSIFESSPNSELSYPVNSLGLPKSISPKENNTELGKVIGVISRKLSKEINSEEVSQVISRYKEKGEEQIVAGKTSEKGEVSVKELKVVLDKLDHTNTQKTPIVQKDIGRKILGKETGIKRTSELEVYESIEVKKRHRQSSSTNEASLVEKCVEKNERLRNTLEISNNNIDSLSKGTVIISETSLLKFQRDKKEKRPSRKCNETEKRRKHWTEEKKKRPYRKCSSKKKIDESCPVEQRSEDIPSSSWQSNCPPNNLGKEEICQPLNVSIQRLDTKYLILLMKKHSLRKVYLPPPEFGMMKLEELTLADRRTFKIIRLAEELTRRKPDNEYLNRVNDNEMDKIQNDVSGIESAILQCPDDSLFQILVKKLNKTRARNSRLSRPTAGTSCLQQSQDTGHRMSKMVSLPPSVSENVSFIKSGSLSNSAKQNSAGFCLPSYHLTGSIASNTNFFRKRPNYEEEVTMQSKRPNIEPNDNSLNDLRSMITMTLDEFRFMYRSENVSEVFSKIEETAKRNGKLTPKVSRAFDIILRSNLSADTCYEVMKSSLSDLVRLESLTTKGLVTMVDSVTKSTVASWRMKLPDLDEPEDEDEEDYDFLGFDSDDGICVCPAEAPTTSCGTYKIDLLNRALLDEIPRGFRGESCNFRVPIPLNSISSPVTHNTNEEPALTSQSSERFHLTPSPVSGNCFTTEKRAAHDRMKSTVDNEGLLTHCESPVFSGSLKVATSQNEEVSIVEDSSSLQRIWSDNIRSSPAIGLSTPIDQPVGTALGENEESKS